MHIYRGRPYGPRITCFSTTLILVGSTLFPACFACSSEPFESENSSTTKLRFTELPARLNIDFGSIVKGEKVFRWIELENGSEEAFAPKSSASDCGCAVGYFKEGLLSPGDKTPVKLGIHPTAAGNFTRTITLFSDSGSNRTVAFVVKAAIVDRFELEPKSIRMDTRESRPIVRLRNPVVKDLSKAKIDIASGKLYTLKTVVAKADTLVLTLELDLDKATALNSGERSAPLQIQLSNLGKVPTVLALPIFCPRKPAVSPSWFDLRRRSDFRFFVSGDFGKQLDELRASRLIIRTHGREIECRVEWRTSRIGVASFNIQAGKHQLANGEAQLWFPSGEVLDLGNVTFKD